MSLKIDPLNLFNSKLKEFIQDLIGIFPDDAEFKACLTAAKIASPSFTQKMFNKYLTPTYKDRIINRDQAFFLDETFDSTVADVGFVSKLKKTWIHLSDENKEFVWQYMILLVLLNDKCNNS